MIGLVFATAMEAAPSMAFLEETSLRHRSMGDTLHVYDFSGASMALSVVGMGKPAAARGARELIRRAHPTILVNLGIAGGLTSDAIIGEIYRVRNAVDWPHAPSSPIAFDAHGGEQLPGLDLVTSDEPIFDSRLRQELSRYGQMVDMEGSAVAAVAMDANLPCVAIKAISDAAKEGHRETLRKNLNEACEKLARLVAQMRFGG